MKPLAEALVNDKVLEGADLAYIDSVRAEAGRDILHLCMECEYSAHIEPGFCHALAFYYVSGHFPCGVEGNPANGVMTIY